MSPFRNIDWQCPDAWGIVACRGVLTVVPETCAACDRWLLENGYELHQFDFSSGISPAVSAFGLRFQWVQQFGYSLPPESRNLDALRDGFDITRERVVFKLLGFERAWLEDATWASGFLSIISEYSLYQLAVGKRFFAMLPVEAQSILVGKPVEELTVGAPFRFRLGEA
jgi:hypothetical protein